jgi:hypothetical protein
VIWVVVNFEEMKKILNNLFYICIIGTLLIFLLPQEYFIAVYSPSILGWLWVLFFLPFTFITYFVGGIYNYRDREWKPIKMRSIVLGIVLILYAFYWVYKVYLS